MPNPCNPALEVEDNNNDDEEDEDDDDDDEKDIAVTFLQSHVIRWQTVILLPQWASPECCRMVSQRALSATVTGRCPPPPPFPSIPS